jgi:hypothetical protein
VLIPLPVNTADPIQQKNYQESCRQCPVQDTCEYTVPGKMYYVAGAVIIRGERIEFPEPTHSQENLF